MFILSMTLIYKVAILWTFREVINGVVVVRGAIKQLVNKKAINPRTLKIKMEEGEAKIKEKSILITICLTISTRVKTKA